MQKNMSHFADFRPVWRGERAHLPLSRSEGLRHGFHIGGETGSVAEIGDRRGGGGRDRQVRLHEFLIG